MNYHGFLFSDSINVSFAYPNSSIENISDKSNISLLTNPVDDFMKISFDKAGIYDCYFYDLSGQLTMKTTIPVSGASVQSINVSGLPAGVGIVKITNGKNQFKEKFLKK